MTRSSPLGTFQVQTPARTRNGDSAFEPPNPQTSEPPNLRTPEPPNLRTSEPPIISPIAHRSHDFTELTNSQRYDLMANLVVPRPIAFVSTLSKDGQPNLAPFSYFMIGGVNPASLAFCPVVGMDGKPKDTLKNVEETGEFVVSLVDRKMAEGMNETSYPYPEGEGEWSASGFTMLPSTRVKPSRVAESPVQFECRLFQALRHGDGPSASVYVIGEVLVAHVDLALADEEGRPIKRFEPIARLGGKAYLDLECGKVFELARPIRPSGSSLD